MLLVRRRRASDVLADAQGRGHATSDASALPPGLSTDYSAMNRAVLRRFMPWLQDVEHADQLGNYSLPLEQLPPDVLDLIRERNKHELQVFNAARGMYAHAVRCAQATDAD